MNIYSINCFLVIKQVSISSEFNRSINNKITFNKYLILRKSSFSKIKSNFCSFFPFINFILSPLGKFLKSIRNKLLKVYGDKTSSSKNSIWVVNTSSIVLLAILKLDIKLACLLLLFKVWLFKFKYFVEPPLTKEPLTFPLVLDCLSLMKVLQLLLDFFKFPVLLLSNSSISSPLFFNLSSSSFIIL